MTAKPNYQKAKYLLSVANLDQLPDDEGAEVAFIGRSNAGKSSALNAITEIKGLARTSKTPGRTQMINFFSLSDEFRLVDLPGYGYAKVPLVMKERWAKNINVYLQTRACLRGLVVVMDIRHPLRPSDVQLLEWSIQCDLKIHVLLTKADKLSYSAARKALKEVQDALKKYEGRVTVQLFSANDLTGVDEARLALDAWLMGSQSEMNE